MSKDPLKLIEEINASIETVKSAQKTANDEIKTLVSAQGTDVAAAVEKANEAVQKVANSAQRIVDLEQKLADGVIKGTASAKSLGDICINSDQFKQFASGNIQKMRIEANTITGANGDNNSNVIVPADRAPGIQGGAFRNLRVADIVPEIQVTGNSFEYTRELAFTNAAAPAAEAAAKAQSSLTFELINTPIRTIATWLKASKQILDDAPALRSYIDTRLRYAADYRFEAQIVSGNGTGQNISGMLDSGNYTAFTPVAGETELDSLNRAQAQIAAADYEATGYILNPADWHAIERIKGNDGHYVIGNPLGTIGRVLWGLPAVLSNAMPAGTFLAANFDIAYAILKRQGTVVEIFEQDEDNVQKNLLTIRSENRGALASFRPASTASGSLLSTETA